MKESEIPTNVIGDGQQHVKLFDPVLSVKRAKRTISMLKRLAAQKRN